MWLARSLIFAAGLICGVLIAVSNASRAQVSIAVLGVSRHSEPGYCEQNPGLGIVYDFASDLRAVGIRYKNSKCHPSNALGVCYTPLHLWSFTFGTCALRLTGYADKALYVPVPTASYALDKASSIDFIGGAKDGKYVIGAGWRFAW